MKQNQALNQNIANILIVDDVAANLNVLGDILKGEGYKVRPVPSGKLALLVIEKEIPDLILLDIMMPDMDGYEVCRLIKENPTYTDIPIIFISALTEIKDIVRAFTLGGVDYISKPFQAEEVKARVKTQLQIHKLSRELKELNATKDKFFSIIAHDLRGPLSGFLGLTELMAKQLSSFKIEDLQEFTSNLFFSASNMYRLLENLLEWSRMQQGLIKLSPEFTTLLPKVQEGIDTIIEQSRKKNIAITCDIPDDFEVFADVNILKTLIRNFLSNAIKFTPLNGNISVSAKKDAEKGVEILVKDTGIGMSPEIRENLFRIDAKTNRLGTEGESSTGLGLILCKDFIEKHGGEIWVESEEFKGSSFHFTFPNKK